MDRTPCADRVNYSYLACPVGSLLGGRPWVSTRKWGLAFSFPFFSASVFAAFKTPFCSTVLFSALSSLSLLLPELPLLLLVLLLLLPVLELLLLALPNGDSGSSGTSRCVERGARRGCEAIRASSALICCTSSGTSSSSSATILLPSPLGPFSWALLLLSAPPASLPSFLPACPCSCLRPCASSSPFSPSCAFYPPAGHKERVKHDQCRRGQYEGQRARRAKHIGRFR